MSIETWMVAACCACGCAAGNETAKVGPYEAAQDACIAHAATLDASPGQKRESADACRCQVKAQYGRPCADGGAR